ncbi:MAG: molybdopterin-dependent oxidoreductase [Acidobacteriota bacterium]
MGRKVFTACTRDCPDACRIIAEVSDGRVTDLKGDPDHPITRGFICSRVRNYQNRLYSDERILMPMLKARGSWKKISWDHAISIAAEKIADAIEKFGNLSILNYRHSGSMGFLKILNDRFFNLLGGASFTSGTLCGGSGGAGQIESFGYRITHAPEDMLNARLVIIWGRNPVNTNIHLVPFLIDVKKKGAKVILIDCIQTQTASFSDFYIQPRQGSDGYLALGVAKYCLKHGEIAKDFIEEYSEGFQNYLDLLESHSMDDISTRTGVSIADIETLGALYCMNHPAAIILGYGLQRVWNGSEIFRAIDSLAVMKGNIGIPGGGVTHGMDEWIHFDKEIAGESSSSRKRFLPLPSIGEAILRTHDPPLKVAWVTGGNVVAQSPDSMSVRRAFESMDFVILSDSFLNDTADVADLFLPTTTFLEEDDLVGSYWHHHILAVNRVIPPVGESRTDLEIFQSVAEKLGFGINMSGTPDDWRAKAILHLEKDGITLDRLRRESVRSPVIPDVPYANGDFRTASGKFMFAGNLKLDAIQRMEYPYKLISSGGKMAHNSQILELDQIGLPDVFASSETLKRENLKDGDMVFLESKVGKIKVRLREKFGIGNDVILFYRGGWLKKGWGVNAITENIVSMKGENASFYDTCVRVRRDQS